MAEADDFSLSEEYFRSRVFIGSVIVFTKIPNLGELRIRFQV
jgi:hypothetical protein